ncbi:MAG: DUF1211 domain-containing protein [Thermogemmatispora sp.]|uniref:TMEM175 family protein n=1 Tax=Thermogemmatispora sp. TaxID=1968838 RepID=UPI0019FA0A67|nr:DUF1211 domain-containing protein [Thermogemmatispora sp.]
MSFFVLNIRLPDALEPFAVFCALLSLLPCFFIHIMIFSLCSSYWYAQHRLMDRMSVVDGGFSALCLLFLFLVTLLPVSMNVFGCYPTISPAIALYTLHLACCGLALVLLTWYAVFHASDWSARLVIKGGSMPCIMVCPSQYSCYLRCCCCFSQVPRCW